MNPLDIDQLNTLAPYKIKEAGKNKYKFSTHSGITYIVGFMEDSMVEEYESYQFFIANESGRHSPNDQNLWITIFSIIEEFFRNNQSVMVYWCETADGQAIFRARLFSRKFHLYQENFKYIIKYIETDTEGIPYYAALIFRKDHPSADEICSKVDYVVEELKKKPE